MRNLIKWAESNIVDGETSISDLMALDASKTIKLIERGIITNKVIKEVVVFVEEPEPVVNALRKNRL